MEYTYKTRGVCATDISFEIRENKLYNVKFTKGCPGNLKAIELLLEGQDIDTISPMLKGNTCGHRSTSCTAQLVLGIEEALASIDK